MSKKETKAVEQPEVTLEQYKQALSQQDSFIQTLKDTIVKLSIKLQ